jgi:hypothetical protein
LQIAFAIPNASRRDLVGRLIRSGWCYSIRIAGGYNSSFSRRRQPRLINAPERFLSAEIHSGMNSAFDAVKHKLRHGRCIEIFNALRQENWSIELGLQRDSLDIYPARIMSR